MPGVLTHAGFRFATPDLPSALRAALRATAGSAGGTRGLRQRSRSSGDWLELPSCPVNPSPPTFHPTGHHFIALSGRGYPEGVTGTVQTPTALDVRRCGVVEYSTAWEEQRRLHAAVVAGEAPDTVLLLEHPSVYTAGKQTQPWDRPTGRHSGGRRRPGRPDHLARAGPAGRLPDRPKLPGTAAARETWWPTSDESSRWSSTPARTSVWTRSGSPADVGCGSPATTSGPTARSPRSASGSPAACPCTGSPSTATVTCRRLRPDRALRHHRRRGHLALG